MNDGCFGLSNANVSNAVVLFYVSDEDECSDDTRCYTASSAGAVGCLLYNVAETEGIFFNLLFSSNQFNYSGSRDIPSGSISLADGLKIIDIVNKNPSAIFTFTDLVERSEIVSISVN